MIELSHRYGAPVSRYAVDELDDQELEPLMVIGAPPLVVSTGAPGARGEVRAYAARVDVTAEQLHTAFRAWLAAKWGDVPPDEQKAPTADEAAFIRDWPPWYAEWNRWVDQLDSFDPLGPTPAQAWQKTQLYDDELEGHRKAFAALATGTPGVKVPEPGKDPDGKGGHEEPGGVASGAASIPWGTITTIVLFVAGAWVISSIAGAVR